MLDNMFFVLTIGEYDAVRCIGMNVSSFSDRTIPSLTKTQRIIRSSHNIRPVFLLLCYVMVGRVCIQSIPFSRVENVYSYKVYANENIFDHDKRKNEHLATFITMINEN
jgi:hypothetical protein